MNFWSYISKIRFSWLDIVSISVAAALMMSGYWLLWVLWVGVMGPVCLFSEQHFG